MKMESGNSEHGPGLTPSALTYMHHPDSYDSEEEEEEEEDEDGRKIKDVSKQSLENRKS